ncbi:MAG: HprK-related kinase B [Pseudomonadota bacterium]
MIFQETERIHLVRRIRDDYPVTEDVHLQFGNCGLRIQSNSGPVISELKKYFSAFISQSTAMDRIISVHQADDAFVNLPFTVREPDPGKTRIKEEYVDIPHGRIVRKRLTGMVFIFGGNDHVVIGPCLENLNQVVNFINNRYIEWQIIRGGILGHAAGVRLYNKGLALAGFSGMGKSTLALHLVSQGADFVSNDRLILEKTEYGIWMHGVCKLPRVNPGTILNNPSLQGLLPPQDYERFASLSKDELWNLEHKYDVPIDRFFGANRFKIRTPLDALIILNWKHNDQPSQMRPVDIEARRDLLPAFIKSTGLFFLPEHSNQVPDLSEAAYIRFLKLSQVFEISGGVDFKAAAKACVQWAQIRMPSC